MTTQAGSLPEGYVSATRECPRCGRVDSYNVPNESRSHVACKCCGMRFEIHTLMRGRLKFGSPTNSKGTFKYASAASHHSPEGLRERMRRYARWVREGKLCAG